MKKTPQQIKNYLFHKNQNKLVYRLISEREKKAIENNDLSQLGVEWRSLNSGNTHKYKKGLRYIHFLDKKSDALTLYRELSKNKQYFCTYSIPTKTLRKYAGKGFYMAKGYEQYSTVKEYAIPSEEFNSDWLISTTPISEFLQETNKVK